MMTNIYIKQCRGQRAFTLIEIVLVLSIIALLLGSAIFNLTGIFERGQEKRVSQDLAAFQTALNLYRMNAGTFPTTEQNLKALTEKPTSTGRGPQRWEQCLKKEQLDPWQNAYGYRFPPEKNRSEPDVWSFGRDGIDGTEDDISNWED